MEQAEVIRLKYGEKVTINLQVVGFSIEGPATVIVVKEKSAAEEATEAVQNHDVLARDEDYWKSIEGVQGMNNPQEYSR